jgi:hypothetical protein
MNWNHALRSESGRKGAVAMIKGWGQTQAAREARVRGGQVSMHNRWHVG